ncbi:hypothetical protein N7457_000732 [Penicillium paradoxum]|uniref:uncharacterized protein n=1 Tax=Penicillium paradoxum TaxID=176176 RepID=UPI002546B947|nr:uncharacterized protein N7457_000732 [Penicillium paradoxum]KAJ5794133.1 hypothetical protein N7457_000732 [Penicillium paradoxum]
MPPFRNFLARKPQPNAEDPAVFDENYLSPNQRPAPIPIRNSQDEPTDLPPPERPSFWRRYPGSNKPTNHRDLVDENEPFSISRESFDSYRRSFDISARSPIIHPDAGPSRTSLDSRFSRLPSSGPYPNGFTKSDTMEEEAFEDVGLNDETKPKKKGFLSRFGDSTSDAQPSGARSSTSSFGFHIPGRKRGQSGVGSELGSMKVTPSANAPADEI